jgi:hypothetical protein
LSHGAWTCEDAGVYVHQTVTIAVCDNTTLAVELDDGDTRIARRTTDQAVRNVKWWSSSPGYVSVACPSPSPSRRGGH